MGEPDRHVAGSFWASFGYAAAGLRWAYQHERNLRVHTVLAAVAVVAGALEGISAHGFEMLAILIVVVIGLELVNTAVEAVTDLAHPARHPLAGLAKDLAAAAVLWAAVGAAAIGVAILAGGVGGLPRDWQAWMRQDPIGLLALTVGLVVVVALAIWIPFPAEEGRSN